MASAAAVAADASRTPLPEDEEDEELNVTGTITSADNYDLGPSVDEKDDEDEDDDDIAPTARRKRLNLPQAVLDDDEDDDAGDSNAVNGDDDLFGSASDDDKPKENRLLDDEDLDSGDDEDRNDRNERIDEDETDKTPPERELVFMKVDVVRHPLPNPSDGELYLLKVPRFLAFEPFEFDIKSFQPPATDHHSAEPPSSVFSAYDTAQTTIRWRRSPSDPSRLQSNARILRWEDGSLTLQLASDPMTQYRIPATCLAPPQRRPPKPTPTSLTGDRLKGQSSEYRPELEGFTYLAAPNEAAQILRITNKLTTSLHVQPAEVTKDDALERLQNSLAAAVRGPNSSNGGEGGIGVKQITEDPEMAKKKAELAEKEKLKAQKRREAQEARDRDRTGRVLGRRFGGGLTVGGLEDDDELGRSGGSGRMPGRPRPKPKRSRRGEIYSEDEDEYDRRGRTREDEYDEEDDFVARSDEEEEVAESDEDEDDGIVEEPRPSSRRAASPEKQRLGTPKREREEDLGAGQDGSPMARSKRRRVIDDDDEEE